MIKEEFGLDDLLSPRLYIWGISLGSLFLGEWENMQN